MTVDLSPYLRKTSDLRAHRSPVTTLAWSADGKLLLSGDADGVSHLWSLSTSSVPRFTWRTPSGSPVVSAAWHSDSRHVALGSHKGTIEIWDARLGRRLSLDEVSSPVHSLAWSPHDRRLAIGGDRMVHFRRYSDAWTLEAAEHGIGHLSEVLRVLWTRDAARVLTATANGTIGVWSSSESDNQLRDIIAAKGIRAHDGEIHAFALSTQGECLTSCGLDGSIRNWRTSDRQLSAVKDLDGELLLDVHFAHGDALLIVHGQDFIHVLSRENLGELARLQCPGTLEPYRSSIATDPINPRLATSDVETNAIAVWAVDYKGLVRHALVTKDRRMAAAVLLVGEPGAGKTTLGRRLSGRPFDGDHAANAFEVQRLQTDTRQVDESSTETREIAVWDLPPMEDPMLARRIAAPRVSLTVLVLHPEPGSELFHNIGRWRAARQRWRVPTHEGFDIRLAVVMHSDDLASPPTGADAKTLCEALAVEHLAFACARRDDDIAAVLGRIRDAIDWSFVPCVETKDLCDTVHALLAEQRARGHHVDDLGGLRATFDSSRPGHLQDTQKDFASAIGYFEALGSVRYLPVTQQVVHSPEALYTYLDAVVRGAQEDPEHMGRVPLDQLEAGRGRQFKLTEKHRLDRPQERRLLSGIVEEMTDSRIAQKVSTDGVTYLVLPAKLARAAERAELPLRTVWHCRFAGAVSDIFRSLVVRLLGLEEHYLRPQLWSNCATFQTPKGHACGIYLDHTAGHDGRLEVLFDDGAEDTERQALAEMTRKHVERRAPDMEWTRAAPVVEPSMRAQSGIRPRVLLYNCSRSSQGAKNVQSIGERLAARDVDAWSLEREVLPGQRRRQQVLDAMSDCRLAVFFVSDELAANERSDLLAMLESGCSVIPAILPHAPVTFSLRGTPLAEYEPVDFRDYSKDSMEALYNGITALWSRLQDEAQGRVMGSGHVFISYPRADADATTRLVTALQARGHSIWWDRLIPAGAYWEQDILDAVNSSYAFLACISASLASRHESQVFKEIQQAASRQQQLAPGRRFIIPVRLSPGPVPAVSLGDGRTLASLQRFDFFDDSDDLSGLTKVLDLARSQSERS